MTRTIEVFADWMLLPEPLRIGSLFVDRVRGKESVSFAYDVAWLESSHVPHLDPELQQYQGFQYPSNTQGGNFGVFLDSCPDRWGRMLMQRRHAQRSRLAGHPSTSLMETDYLLGVHDEQRLGGLRFRESSAGPFLSNDADMAAPPWTALRDLEHAAWAVQTDATGKKLEESLRILMAPGSSIGGARPKAGVTDENHQLWIAKFPGRNDERDISAWEMVAHRLAEQAGLNVAESRLEAFGKQHRTFLSKRFDRLTIDAIRRRKHFASAMTMLGYVDGASHSSGASYLELAQWIIQNQSVVDEDLEELWRRIVFSILIHNTDDHLRNHGFLLTENGWRLSPAYDLNADPEGVGLSLNISESDNSLDVALARSVAHFFRVGDATAKSIIAEVTDAVASWNRIATELGISRSEGCSRLGNVAFHVI